MDSFILLLSLFTTSQKCKKAKIMKDVPVSPEFAECISGPSNANKTANENVEPRSDSACFDDEIESPAYSPLH